MSFIRATILLICLSLFATGVANASMLYCMDGQDTPVEMQMDGEQPCHDMESGNMTECDCQHCLQMTTLPSLQLEQGFSASIVKTHIKHIFNSRKLESLQRPPIFIS